MITLKLNHTNQISDNFPTLSSKPSSQKMSQTKVLGIHGFWELWQDDSLSKVRHSEIVKQPTRFSHPTRKLSSLCTSASLFKNWRVYLKLFRLAWNISDGAVGFSEWWRWRYYWAPQRTSQPLVFMWHECNKIHPIICCFSCASVLRGTGKKKQNERIYPLPQKIVVCFELLGKSSLTVDSLVHGDEKVARLKEIIQPDMVVRSGKKNNYTMLW